MKYILILLGAYLYTVSIPHTVYASALHFSTDRSTISVQDDFVLQVFIDTEGESINAVEGGIIFPDELLEVKEIRDGNSAINLWIERPKLDPTQTIVFSGVSPGGLQGDKQQLFSIVFTARKGGRGVFYGKDIHALKNDGVGTEDVFRGVTSPIVVSDTSRNNPIRIAKAEDTEPPEAFTPAISSEESMFGGKFFIVFATQDKGGGIDHYEIREGESGVYVTATSPYVLPDQSLTKTIYVKAVDMSGNERLATMKALGVAWYKQYGIFAILIVLAMLVFSMYFRKKRRNH